MLLWLECLWCNSGDVAMWYAAILSCIVMGMSDGAYWLWCYGGAVSLYWRECRWCEDVTVTGLQPFTRRPLTTWTWVWSRRSWKRALRWWTCLLPTARVERLVGSLFVHCLLLAVTPPITGGGGVYRNRHLSVCLGVVQKIFSESLNLL